MRQNKAPISELIHAVTGFEEDQCHCADDPLREFVFNVARERIAKLQAQAGTNLEVASRSRPHRRRGARAGLQQQADLVLIGRGIIQKPLGRLRSNAYAIIRDAPCPVISM